MKLVFATNNKNKLAEIQTLVGDHFTILSLDDIGCNEDIPETQPTIEGNARQKAQYIHEKYKVDCFADDTGLEIDALNGAPGVISARYAGPACSPDDNMQKVLKLMTNEINRNAKFRTVISLFIDGHETQFEGDVNGIILTEKQGDKGFGYDPIFMPDGYNLSFAQLPMETKNQISHRGKATVKLIKHLKTNY